MDMKQYLPEIDHPTGKDNFTRLDIYDAGGVPTTYWYSYSTCVGVDFHDSWGPRTRVNEWGPTTGKHLNYIDGGNRVDRLSEEDFGFIFEEGADR